MKKIVIICASLIVALSSCGELYKEAPEGGFKIYDAGEFENNITDLSKVKDISNDTIFAGDSIVFYTSGEADFYTLWMGEPSNDYNKRNLPDSTNLDTVTSYIANVKSKGTAISYNNKSQKTFYKFGAGYPTAGNYTVVVTSRNVFENSSEIMEKVDSINILVADRRNQFFPKDGQFRRFDINKPVAANIISEYTSGDNIYINVVENTTLTGARIFLKAVYSEVEVLDGKGTVTYSDFAKTFVWNGTLPAINDANDFIEFKVTSPSGYVRIYKLFTVNIVAQ